MAMQIVRVHRGSISRTRKQTTRFEDSCVSIINILTDKMLYFPKILLLCGNKMPTRCNRLFYCRSHCLLNMFRAPLCPSSGAREYFTVGCCLWYLVLWFSSCRYGVGLRVMCPVCPQTGHTTIKNYLFHLVDILFPQIIVMFIANQTVCLQAII